MKWGNEGTAQNGVHASIKGGSASQLAFSMQEFKHWGAVVQIFQGKTEKWIQIKLPYS